MATLKKIKWNGLNPVVFYDRGERIEMKQGDIKEVSLVPSGTGFELLSEESLSDLEKGIKFEEFRLKLDKSGLSPIRKGKVLSKFKSEEELADSLNHLPFDEVTNKFLQEMFKKMKKKEDD